MKAGKDLVKVITSTHAHFPVVILKKIARVLELSRIALSLMLCEAFSRVVRSYVLHVVVIQRL